MSSSSPSSTGRSGTLLLRLAAMAAGVVVAVAGAAPALAAPPSSTVATAVVPGLARTSGPARVTTVASPSVTRISGADRYAVSVAASKRAFPTGTHPDVVYLVSGTSVWQSLSATPAAVRGNGAVLLTAPGGIPGVVATELARLAPAKIVVVGSTTTLSSTVLSQARSYAASVVRIAGDNRYQTAYGLVRHAFPAGSATEVWITTGRVWADALAAGAAAAAHRAPLLTVDGTASSLNSAIVNLIRDLGATSATIVGAPAVMSRGIETQLDGILGADHVTRASASDRYGVAARVNQLAFPSLDPGTAYLANGREFVFALAGGFLAGRNQRPLYYTLPYCVPGSVRPGLAGTSVTRVALIGGERSLRGLVGTLEACRSIRAPSSTWVLVNKHNALRPKSYVPSNLVVPNVTYPNGQRLRSDAAAALTRMFSAARSEGAGRMKIASGYRSYSTQYSVYWHRVSTNGRAYADAWIARPGYSEHQTGLSLDIAPVGDPTCSVHNCIGSTPQGAWLKRNSWRFGFVLRYEDGYTSITGYNREPWHFRYVGTALSTGYHGGGWHTFEQFLDEPAAPTY